VFGGNYEGRKVERRRLNWDGKPLFLLSFAKSRSFAGRRMTSKERFPRAKSALGLMCCLLFPRP